MSRRIFSTGDDAILKRFYPVLTNKELVELFNGQFSQQQLKERGHSLNLKKAKDTKQRSLETRAGAWEDWEKIIIEKHYSSGGVDMCLKYLPHRTASSICHKAQRMGLRLDYKTFCEKKANGPSRHSEKAKAKVSLARRDVPKSAEHREKIGAAQKGPKHWNWKDGRSFKNYGPDFNQALKRKIKARDKFTCQLCGQVKGWSDLHIHHIDYDEPNNKPTNLITLCKDCHNKHHNVVSTDERKRQQVFFLTLLGVPNQEFVSSNTNL